MFGAVAAGKAAGGYDSITEASQRMAGLRDETFAVSNENHKAYERLYGEYVRLHDLFGRGGIETMKTLRKIRTEALGARLPVN